MHDKVVFYPLRASKLTRKQKMDALCAIIFLKQTRCGRIKGRTVADGRKQRKNSIKTDATSPTVTTESVLITAAIEATKGRDVAVINAPGSFLTTPQDDEEIISILQNEMVDAMLEINRDTYEHYVIKGNN